MCAHGPGSVFADVVNLNLMEPVNLIPVYRKYRVNTTTRKQSEKSRRWDMMSVIYLKCFSNSTIRWHKGEKDYSRFK